MTTKILWWSNHGPQQRHIDLLEKMYGDVKVTHKKGQITAESVEREYFSDTYRDLYIAGPLSVLERVTELGLEPLIEDRVRVHKNNADYFDGHNHWKIKGLKHLKKIVRYTSPAVPKP
jgi:hypothetical protein